MHARHVENVERQLSQTLDYLRQVDSSKETENRDNKDSDLDAFGELESQEASQKLSELVRQVQHLSSLVGSMPTENRVLRRLFFQSIFRREHDVLDPADKTFRWIFDEIQGSRGDIQDLSDDSHEPPTITPDCDEELGSGDMSRRRDASKSFVEFLRGNARTFFVVGKAGCGKSTFMKYIAYHNDTVSCLRYWAGDAKLLVVRTFFWQSDDYYQGSLEGFWRSILFQILSQCPELISEVFPQTRPEAEDLSDAVEFRIPELEAAFKKLLELCNPERYRFCCFIDGLDEHQGDNLGHDHLAGLLVSWVIQPNVKVLCSSRPSAIFLDAFRETGPIIEFHKLTGSDVANFAKARFRTSLAKPKMLSAQQNCIALTGEITARAEGVFLWASLAVRALINQALDHDGDRKALQRRLEECPDNLQALFHQMLNRVDQAHGIQMRSNMVLYLAVHNPFEAPLNVLIYSWLDELGWFEGSGSLDTSSPSKPLQKVYPAAQIHSRKDRVRSRESLLHQLTEGLLEIVPTDDSVIYLRYRVDLYHRSTSEFLQDQWGHGARRNPFASASEQLQVYCRLRSIEAKGIAMQMSRKIDLASFEDTDAKVSLSTNLRSLFEHTFLWLAECTRQDNTPPMHCLRDFQDALNDAQNRSQPFLLGLMLISDQLSWRYHSRIAHHACSFIHWTAYWSQNGFVKSYCSPERLDIVSPGSDLSLLLSSSVAADVQTTRHLLSHDYRPDDLIQITDTKLSCDTDNTRELHALARETPVKIPVYHDMKYQSDGPKHSATVWMVLLRDFANNLRSYCHKRKTSASWPLHLDRDRLERLALIVETYLRAGADPRVFFVVLVEDTSHPCEITLYQMLDALKPSNLPSLADLLSDQPWWKHFLAGRLPLQHSTGMHRRTNAEFLLHDEWRVLGVRSESGRELMGSFKVRVF